MNAGAEYFTNDNKKCVVMPPSLFIFIWERAPDAILGFFWVAEYSFLSIQVAFVHFTVYSDGQGCAVIPSNFPKSDGGNSLASSSFAFFPLPLSSIYYGRQTMPNGAKIGQLQRTTESASFCYVTLLGSPLSITYSDNPQKQQISNNRRRGEA